MNVTHVLAAVALLTCATVLAAFQYLNVGSDEVRVAGSPLTIRVVLVCLVVGGLAAFVPLWNLVT